MVVPPKSYQRLSEIQTELLRAPAAEPTAEMVGLMREGVGTLRQFQGIDTVGLDRLAARLSATAPAPEVLAEDRDWLTDQIGHVLTRWNEWRREPWLED